MTDAGFLGPIAGGLIVVAAHHVDLNPILAKLLNGLAGIGFQRLALLQGQIAGTGKVDVAVGNRQRSCFVDHHGIHSTHVFKCRSVFYQYIFLGSFAYTNHQGCRCSQSHGARTSYNQHGHSRKNGMRECFVSASYPPCEKRHERQTKHTRYENHGYLVDNPLHGSLRALSLFHHLDDAGDGCLLTGLTRAETQSALLKHCSGQHS